MADITTVTEKTHKLKVTKPDGSIHYTGVANKARYEHMNSLVTAEHKWKVEVVAIKDIDHTVWKDEAHAKAHAGGTLLLSEKIKELENAHSEKDAELLALREKLAQLENKPEPELAKDVIEKINAAKSVAEVDKLIENETRKTVLDAAEKKKASL